MIVFTSKMAVSVSRSVVVADSWGFLKVKSGFLWVPALSSAEEEEERWSSALRAWAHWAGVRAR